MKNELGTLMIASTFLLGGVACFFFPDKIQTAALKYFARYPSAARLNPFLEWMKGHSYIISLRIVGFIGIAVFILTLIAFARGR